MKKSRYVKVIEGRRSEEVTQSNESTVLDSKRLLISKLKKHRVVRNNKLKRSR